MDKRGRRIFQSIEMQNAKCRMMESSTHHVTTNVPGLFLNQGYRVCCTKKVRIRRVLEQWKLRETGVCSFTYRRGTSLSAVSHMHYISTSTSSYPLSFLSTTARAHPFLASIFWFFVFCFFTDGCSLEDQKYLSIQRLFTKALYKGVNLQIQHVQYGYIGYISIENSK